MCDEAAGLAIVFNGDIYNYLSEASLFYCRKWIAQVTEEIRTDGLMTMLTKRVYFFAQEWRSGGCEAIFSGGSSCNCAQRSLVCS